MAAVWRTRLFRSEVASAAGENRGPDRGVGGLLAGAEKENSVRSKQAMNVAEQGPARLLREIKHDIAQEDDVEAIAGALERKTRPA